MRRGRSRRTEPTGDVGGRPETRPRSPGRLCIAADRGQRRPHPDVGESPLWVATSELSVSSATRVHGRSASAGTRNVAVTSRPSAGRIRRRWTRRLAGSVPVARKLTSPTRSPSTPASPSVAASICSSKLRPSALLAPNTRSSAPLAASVNTRPSRFVGGASASRDVGTSSAKRNRPFRYRVVSEAGLAARSPSRASSDVWAGGSAERSGKGASLWHPATPRSRSTRHPAERTRLEDRPEPSTPSLRDLGA